MDIHFSHSEPGMTVLCDHAKTNAWLFFSLLSDRACIVTFQQAWYNSTSSHIHGWRSDSILGCTFPTTETKYVDTKQILDRINNWILEHSKNTIVIIEDLHDWIWSFLYNSIDPTLSIINFLRQLYDLVINRYKGRVLIRLHQDMMNAGHRDQILIENLHQFISSWLHHNSHELIYLNPLSSGLSRSIDGEYMNKPGGMSSKTSFSTWQYRWVHSPFSLKYWQKGSGQIFTLTK